MRHLLETTPHRQLQESSEDILEQSETVADINRLHIVNTIVSGARKAVEAVTWMEKKDASAVK
jgi:hypothetical protein